MPLIIFLHSHLPTLTQQRMRCYTITSDLIISVLVTFNPIPSPARYTNSYELKIMEKKGLSGSQANDFNLFLHFFFVHQFRWDWIKYNIKCWSNVFLYLCLSNERDISFMRYHWSNELNQSVIVRLCVQCVQCVCKYFLYFCPIVA